MCVRVTKKMLMKLARELRGTDPRAAAVILDNIVPGYWHHAFIQELGFDPYKERSEAFAAQPNIKEF